jgi:hypothetical protein
MFANHKIARLFLIAGLGLSALVSSVSAASPPSALLIAPGEPYGLPKFGFSSSTIPGYGEQVVYIRPGGRAARLGLEPGDVILSLNGFRLTYSGSWNDALSHALYSGGYVQLQVRDVRTGFVRVKSTYVGPIAGPVEHHYRSGISLATPHVILNLSAHR